jgi:hypothetical protein
MQNPERPLVALESLRWSEISTETRIDVETSDDGLRLLSAFMRIHDPTLRAAAIDFVSGLAERSEQP